jgi:hypothetical protein
MLVGVGIINLLYANHPLSICDKVFGPYEPDLFPERLAKYLEAKREAMLLYTETSAAIISNTQLDKIVCRKKRPPPKVFTHVWNYRLPMVNILF